jgi:methylated-DNA-[protein]-cysteine S-methyltransferase
MDDFSRRIYTALRGVGFGSTVTYGDLAKELGLEGWEGARDIGAAMGHNRVPIVIPCHRVLAAGNKPGGFSAYGGVTTKQKLLALEGVRLGEAPDAPPRLPGL